MNYFIVSLYLSSVWTLDSNIESGEDSIWPPLPAGFDQKNPDNILELVRNDALEDEDNYKTMFSHLYVFGDSTCDIGNLYHLDGENNPQYNHYWHGRLSNGPIWPDYLQSQFNFDMNNYCYGGATVLNSNHIVKARVPDFPAQIDEYEATKFNTTNPLTIIQFSGNDLLNSLITATKLISDIETQLQRLVDIGEIRHFLIFETNNKEYIDKGLNVALYKMVDQFQVQNPDILIHVIPVIDVGHKMQKIPPPTADSGHWITNIPCYNDIFNILCSDPENYLLFDSYHATTVPHYNIAYQLGQILQSLDWS